MLGSKRKVHFQRHRLPRYSAEDFEDSLVELQISNTNIIKAKPLNFSKYGLAFQVNDEMGKFLVHDRQIERIRFSAFGEIFFEGPVEVRHSQLEQGAYTVGVFTQNRLIKVERILGLKIGHQLVHGKNGFNVVPQTIKISEEFQLLVNQYRDYLMGIKNALDKTEKEIESLPVEEKSEVEKTVLLSLEPSFSEKSDFYMEIIGKACGHFEDEERIVYKNYFQAHLHELILLCPFMDRCLRKPLGYPGDYRIMNMIYEEDRYTGDSLFAKLENYYWTSISTARATKVRMEYLASKIEEIVKQKIKQNGKVKITSLGSGPAREIAEFIKRSALSDHCIFTCVDLDPQALEYSRQTLSQIAEAHKRAAEFNHVSADVVSYLRSKPQDFMFEQDLIYAAGLYDYLRSSIAKKLTESLFPLIREGGDLVLMNVSTSNPGRIKVEFGADWFLIHRTKEEMLDFTSEIRDHLEKQPFLDKDNVYWYVSLKK